jgi:hypothetical protein
MVFVATKKFHTNPASRLTDEMWEGEGNVIASVQKTGTCHNQNYQILPYQFYDSIRCSSLNTLQTPNVIKYFCILLFLHDIKHVIRTRLCDVQNTIILIPCMARKKIM